MIAGPARILGTAGEADLRANSIASDQARTGPAKSVSWLSDLLLILQASPSIRGRREFDGRGLLMA